MNPSSRATEFVPSAIELGARSENLRITPQSITSIQIFNGLGRPVSAAYRTGIRQTIPNLINASRQAVMIRLSYITHAGVNVDTALLLNDDGNEGSKSSQLLHASAARKLTEFHHSGVGWMNVAHVDYFVSMADFQANGSSVYIDELDIVLSLNSLDETPFHPHSLHGVRDRLMPSPLDEVGQAFHYRVEIHDRDGVFGDRFVNVGGEVFPIKRRTDQRGRAGVYVVSSYPANTITGVTSQRVRHYTFEEADKALHLYHSALEAQTHGNPADLYKKELEDLAHQNKVEENRMKAEARRRDAEFESRKRDWEMEQQEAKRDQLREERRLRDRAAELDALQNSYRLQEHQLKLDKLYRTDMYEQRSDQRKNWQESFKLFPVLLTLVAAGIAAYKKFSD